MEIIQAP